MTRNEARQYFKDCGLTYQKVLKSAYVNDLAIMVNEELNKYNKTRSNPYLISVNKKSIKVKWNDCFELPVCFLTGKGEYFDAREVISFNGDGFIGFSGNADDQNIQPILKAFTRWCDYVKKIAVVIK